MKQFIVWIGLAIFWSILAFFSSDSVFPSLASMGSELFTERFIQLFALDTSNTFSVLIPGILLGWLLAYLLHFMSLKVSDYYRQLFNGIRFVPLPAIIPLGILLLGLGIGSQLLLVVFGAWILTTGFLIEVYESDFQRYKNAIASWRESVFIQYKSFIEQSWHLSYRLWPSLIVWSLGNIILSELVIGGDFGLGIRMIESQQLFNGPRLWLYVILTCILGIIVERILHWSSSYLIWTRLRTIGTAALSFLLILTTGFLVFRINPRTGFVVTTYNATANLPLMVMAAEFNSQGYELEFAPSGITALQSFQGNKTRVAGYVDMPNILSADIDGLKIVSQVVEQPDRPVLYLFTQSNSLEDLEGAISYFPNNILMRSGLDFALFAKGVNTNQLTYQSSNDPNSLVQAFRLDKIDGLLIPEPFATQIEEQSDKQRINADETIIRGINFNSLPLAGTILNTDELSATQEEQVIEDLDASIDFIRENNQDGEANQALATIMETYDLNSNSRIPGFTKSDEFDLDQTNIFVSGLNLYDPSLKLDTDKVEGLY